MVNPEILQEKFCACLLGLAVGDAIGALFEGFGVVSKADIYNAIEKIKILRYTDDTHMAIGTAESLIACRGFDGQHMAETFMRNFEQEPWRGYAPGPPRIFRRIKLGVRWDRAAEDVYPGGSLGNGAAMRAAPLGLFYFHDHKKLREVTYLASQITHAHPLGKEGATLQAYAVALALEGGPSASTVDLLAQLKTSATHQVYKDKLEKAGDLLSRGDKSKVPEVVFWLGNGVEAFNSVPAAIYCFLRHPFSFKEAIVEAVSLGGDTDTIASMTGALSGAWLGMESIPSEWVNKLENKDYIRDLALKLWEGVCEQT